ncbi:MAG: glutamine synthetase type III, partial [Kiritimatiellae bacterium]|nr:glutamine synthetase type III [Kiritimatiellia bacterium]
RAPGASQNCAASQMVLNTIVAESIDAICDKLDALVEVPKGSPKYQDRFNEELQKLLQRLIRKHGRVLFSGDGYGADWLKEAAKRGLPNLRDTVEAIAPMEDPANRALFARYGVLSEGEMASRHEIAAEDYASRVLIEGKVALEIARSMIRPVVADEFSRLATAIGRATRDGLKVGIAGLKALSLKLGAGLDDLHVKCERLEKAIAKGSSRGIIAEMDDLRRTVDRLEYLVDDSKWPLPKYREMLFIY